MLMMEGRIIFWLIFIRLVENINCENPAWDCKFPPQSDGITLDFSTLYDKTNDYYIHHDEKDKNESLRIQMCGPLHDKCNGQEGYSACLRTGNKEIGLGRIPINSHEDGRVMFNFTGDKCKDDNYKLQMIIICDYKANTAYPELFPYAKDQCHFLIIWRTILACARYEKNPVTPVNCTVKDKTGNVYDLSNLKLLDTNYIVDIDKNSSIILNVCHPVVYGYKATCLDDSGACLRTISGGIKYKSIGSVASVKLEGNTPVLNYKIGELCTDGTHAQTTISFICDYKANNTVPVLTGVENNCYYKLSWRTTAACNVRNLEEFSRRSATPCKLTNPVTLIEYNLNSLKGEDRIVKTKNGSEYKFSICGPVLSKFCQTETKNVKGEAGVCASSNKAIGGIENSNLLWNVTGPYLNYTDGSPCDKNKTRATIISFACEREGSNKTSFIDDDDPCNLRIQYYTPLVCEKENTVCGYGLEVDANGLCINRSSSQLRLSTTPSMTNEAPTNQNTIKEHTGIIITVTICGLAVIFIGVCLLNSQKRQYLRSRYCSWSFRNSDVRMQYSKINTNEETDALLDAPDTHCQSDSDDDLLRI